MGLCAVDRRRTSFLIDNNKKKLDVLQEDVVSLLDRIDGHAHVKPFVNSVNFREESRQGEPQLPLQ